MTAPLSQPRPPRPARLEPWQTRLLPAEAQDWDALLYRWGWETVPGALPAHAQALGVSHMSLFGLGACWASQARAWAFPMRDPEGFVIGIRLRNEAGEKWAVTGSQSGLFFDPLTLEPDPDDSERVLYVCEGPTDTAAMLTLGFPAVGRASCHGQDGQVSALCRNRGFARLVIMADNDTPKERRDGTLFFPGREGAQAFAKAVQRPYKLVMPPAKDIRAWLAQGATREAVLAAARQKIWKTG